MGILDRLGPQIRTIGKAGVNALFPNDFEYYVITLELTNSNGETIDYLTFPVTPSSIEYDDVSIVNIKKAFGANTSLDTEEFVPKTILLSGNFGRKLKLLISPPTTDTQSSSNGVFDNLVSNGLQVQSSVLDVKLKTGYGTTKLLEGIVTKSRGLDQFNKPNRLYLYIPPLGHNFLVKVNMFKLAQDLSTNNMMWKYSMSLTAMSKIEDLEVASSQNSTLINSTAIDVLQRSANSAVNSIKSSVF